MEEETTQRSRDVSQAGLRSTVLASAQKPIPTTQLDDLGYSSEQDAE